jgi:peptide-methionine (S)-S-oxide reductase
MLKKIISILIANTAIILVLMLFASGCSIKGEIVKKETENGKNENQHTGNSQKGTAVLGGGCFWCLEAVFEQLKGVKAVDSGYAGGLTENPTYEEVCTGNTGHAEVIRIEFDPEIITYRQILEVFFYVHDPTTLNRQGNDIGEQYRSIILYSDENQKKTAEEMVAALGEQGIYADPIVTEIKPLDVFYRAEDYHQSYYVNNTSQAYCQIVISPKVEKFQDKFKDLLK